MFRLVVRSVVVVVPLLLCVSATAMWVRGYFAGDLLSWARETLHGQRFEYRTVDVFSTHGGLRIAYGYYRRDLPAAEAAAKQPRPSNIGVSRFDDYAGYPRPLGDTPITLANLLGFRAGWNGGVDPILHTTNSTLGIVIPFWFPSSSSLRRPPDCSGADGVATPAAAGCAGMMSAQRLTAVLSVGRP